jgi:hypothetical protein
VIDVNSFGTDDAGAVSVTASESIRLTGDGEPFSLIDLVTQGNAPATGIFSATVRGGDGGSLTLEAPEITVERGAFVSTSSVGGGAAGEVRLTGARIRVLDGSFVDSASLPHPLSPRRSGSAGSVTLTATHSIEVSGHLPGRAETSRVASATVGSGTPGTVTLDAPRIRVEGGAVATTALADRRGREGASGGAIVVRADDLLVTNGGLIDASSFISGPGGSIDVRARDSIRVEGEGSAIVGRAGGAGAGGDVALRAPRITVARGGEVSAGSAAGYAQVARILLILVHPETNLFVADEPATATGNAGAIAVFTDDLLVDHAAITTSAESADGGDITVLARDRVHLVGGEITAAVNDGAGGNIAIDPTFVILEDGSRIVADAGTGSGGNIQITADNFFAFPGSVIDASSRFGLDGTVAIHTPDTSLAGTLAALPGSYLDASSQMRERCAARASGERAGSFTVRGTGGVPADPDGWLPASLSAALEGGAAAPLATPVPGAATPWLASGSCR